MPPKVKFTSNEIIEAAAKIKRTKGIDAVAASRGYALTIDIKPEHEMDKAIYAADELTGLIGAVAVMRPSKSVSDLKLKSVKKKYKNLNFAAGCSREIVKHDADMLVLFDLQNNFSHEKL